MLPPNPADCFCDLWDAYAPGWTVADVEAWQTEADLTTIENRAAEIWSEGRVPAAWEAPGPYEAFLTCRAIDEVLTHFHPRSGSTSASAVMPAITITHATTGRFNEEAPGALVPRWVHPARPGDPSTVAEHFSAVIRISPATFAEIEHVVVPSDQDLTPAHGTSLVPIRAGCVPVVDDLGSFDIGVTATGAGGHPRYGIRLRPDAVPADLVRTILQGLDAEQASIGVAPELTLCQQAADTWASECATSKPTFLRWVVAGTGELAPEVNRALLLEARTGATIATQDKRHRFSLTSDQVEEWELGPLDGHDVLEEPIQPGARLAVIESVAGRFVILICEDLSRIAAQGVELQEVSPSHILTPIFDKEILAYRWHETRAGEWLSSVGSFAVVSNSLAVLRAREATGRAHPPDDSGPFSAMAFLPSDLDPSKYPGDAQRGLAASASDITTFDLSLD